MCVCVFVCIRKSGFEVAIHCLVPNPAYYHVLCCLPQTGALALTDLSARHRHDLPEVLRGVSVAIPSGARSY
jgi:hypothetical protein